MLRRLPSSTLFPYTTLFRSKKFHDRLLGLIDSRNGLLGVDDDAVDSLDWYLEFELGDDAKDYNGRNHAAAAGKDPKRSPNKVRSEEHTSELQSHVNLVCRLL